MKQQLLAFNLVAAALFAQSDGVEVVTGYDKSDDACDIRQI